MIPKIIHYCWLSTDPYPEKIQYCLQTWKQYLPDYEIRLWDLNRFDLSLSSWVQEAYQCKKYAFAADYIRCYALYHFGGIYLDSDVEVLRSYDDLLHLPYFLGQERVTGMVEAATMGAEPGLPLFKYLLDYYDHRHFLQNGIMDTCVMPRIMDSVIHRHYQICPIATPDRFKVSEGTICILPSEYFSPKENEQLFLTSHTYSIHHYTGSWRPKWYNTLRKVVLNVFGVRFKKQIGNLLRIFFNKQQ